MTGVGACVGGVQQKDAGHQIERRVVHSHGAPPSTLGKPRCQGRIRHSLVPLEGAPHNAKETPTLCRQGAAEALLLVGLHHVPGK